MFFQGDRIASQGGARLHILWRKSFDALCGFMDQRQQEGEIDIFAVAEIGSQCIEMIGKIIDQDGSHV